MGASAVAGEERDGTIGLLLANPRSRRQVLVSKTAAMVGLVVAGSALVLAAAHLAPVLLDVSVGASNINATIVHLFANTLLWGALAGAIGAATGNRATASAIAAGFMVANYFLVGLLPLLDSLSGAAKVLPWYWFDGHDPLNNACPSGTSARSAQPSSCSRACPGGASRRETCAVAAPRGRSRSCSTVSRATTAPPRCSSDCPGAPGSPACAHESRARAARWSWSSRW